jgi:hypothetical protein
MMRLKFLSVLALMAACAPTVPDQRVIEEDVLENTSDFPEANAIEPEPSEPGLADIELCDAKDYRHLIGAVAAQQNFPEGPEFRVYSVNDIITQEYLPNRTNVVVTMEGLVFRVYCG